MGMFKKKVKVTNSKDSSLWFESEFWIDTGALYSFIPENLANQINFEPISTRDVFFADGKTSKCLFGTLNFEIEGFKESIPCPVVIGAMNTPLLLGATTLENFAVEVDPVHKSLIPIQTLIGGFRATR
jgi:predicted aspartyl protease